MTADVFDFNQARRIDQLEAEQRSRATVEVEDVRARLHADPRSFVQWLFSGRAHVARGEARIGDVSGRPGASLSIALTGADAGLWHDHATGEGGDLISLYMAYMGYRDGRNFQLALKEIAAEFLQDPVKVERPTWQRSANDRIAEKKQALGTKPRDDLLELGAPVHTWKYLDTSGVVIASVVRYEPDGTSASKTYRPWCHKTVDGRQKWMMGAPALRPLYRLPDIVLASTVVLCEGEKCADALASVGLAATTAMQGAEAPIEKTDWSPIHGKRIVVWPDNDEPGLKYGRQAAEHLAALGHAVSIVAVPAGKPTKWDAADCVAEGSDAHAIVSSAVPLTAEPKPRIRLLTLAELESLPPPAWLIDGLITRAGLSMLWGRSGSLKSFIALDMAMSVACGLAWHGRAVQGGNVIYVAAEGAYGLASRAIGWWRLRAKDRLTPPPIKIIPHSLNLTTGDDLDALIQTLVSEAPSLVVVDTMSRTFGNGNPNQPSDVNSYVSSLSRLQESVGSHVMVVHHAGKDQDKNEIGNEGVRNACDTVIYVKRFDDSRVELVNEAPKGKQKDAEEIKPINLRPAKVSFTQGGVERTTLLMMLDDGVVVEGAEASKASKPVKLGTNESKVIKALQRAKEPLGFMRLHALVLGDEGTLGRTIRNLEAKKLIEMVTVDGLEGRRWQVV